MNDKAFSSIDLVGQCLLDKERTNAFGNAIKKYVRPGSIVLDIGTGSGIMALFAARAGAKRVYAIEFDPYVAEIARKNIKENNYGKIIKVIVADARDIKFSNRIKFDLVTMEMLTSGMVDEFQIQAVNNLYRQGVLTHQTFFIPMRQETYVTLSQVDFSRYGFNMKMITHLWKYFPQKRIIVFSKPTILSSIGFSEIINENFDTHLSIKITKTGTINCLLLSSKSFLNPKIFLTNTKSLNPSVEIPLLEKKVLAGELITIRIKYQFGAGYQSFSANFV